MILLNPNFWHIAWVGDIKNPVICVNSDYRILADKKIDLQIYSINKLFQATMHPGS